MHYDFIFAGAGCSALSLAYRLNQSPLKNSKILLIDKQPKNQNDRTWCFWANEPTPFDAIACQRWEKIFFRASPFSQSISIAPYSYQMIKGIDFYQFVLQDLAQNNQIEWVFGEIESLQTIENKATVVVNNEKYTASWAFNSLFDSKNPKPRKYHYLLQHFKGWVIETEKPTFTVDNPTFMDFDIAQNQEVRFMYVLPQSSTKALVEFTLFSPELLSSEEYEKQLLAYLKTQLQIENFTILEEEFGIIPMTTLPLKLQHSPKIMNIGTNGGFTKASTGYTFMNIQRQSDRILSQLQLTGQPFYKKNHYNRFRLYDAMLLDILATNRYAGKEIFRIMFQKHPVERIFKFLDEKTSFLDELKIMLSMPPKPFLIALYKQFGKIFL